MSKQAIIDLLHQALGDPEFFHRFLFSPDSVLSAFSLTTTERIVLTARTPDDLLTLVVSGGEKLECAPNTCQVTCNFTCSYSLVDRCDSTVVNYISPADASMSGIQQVVDRARRDPSFFKTLRESPDAALVGIPLPPSQRAVLGANTPEKLLGLVVGSSTAAAGCDDTCSYTCANTCSGAYTMSCGGTCGYTCDYTAGVQLLLAVDSESVLSRTQE